MNSDISEMFRGVWSAAPTPLDRDRRVDISSVERMVEQHVRLGVNGLFLAGTCGEGSQLPNEEKRRLVRAVAETANGRLVVAVQVTDPLPARIRANIEQAREDGADIAMMGAPPVFDKPTAERIPAFYLDVAAESSLPVGLYDLGNRREYSIPESSLARVYAEPNVVIVKDSSSDPRRRRIALQVRESRPELKLFNGDEFNCVEYLKSGYDGLMLGGGIFNGYIAGMIVHAVKNGDLDEAERLQQRMTALMHAVYGGPEISCWLGGLKHFLVEIGVFSTNLSFADYPLTESCKRAVKEAIESERDILFPEPDGEPAVRM